MVTWNFSYGSNVKVVYWSVCLGDHQQSVKHYHMVLKLSGSKRWAHVKKNIMQQHGVLLNFLDTHDNYYSAHTYLSKKDNDVFLSRSHPDLEQIASRSATTSKMTEAYRVSQSQKRKQRQQDNSTPKPTKAKLYKTRRLTNLEVSEYIVQNDIQKDVKLLALADQRQAAGQKDLANFILSKSPKQINDLIENTWRMKNASRVLERSTRSRMELIRQTANDKCSPGCDGQWLQCAVEVLRNNKHHPFVFAEALRTLLEKGRGKFRNIFIYGPGNSAKTFILKPLEKIFKTFVNPSNDKYAWVGADEAEVILMQDFRWNSECIKWSKLLLLLEGEKVNLPSPKNHFCNDVCIAGSTPIFATSKAPIEYVGNYNVRDTLETEMMALRWKNFEFTHRIPESEQKSVPPCARCFSELTLMGEINLDV